MRAARLMFVVCSGVLACAHQSAPPSAQDEKDPRDTPFAWNEQQVRLLNYSYGYPESQPIFRVVARTTRYFVAPAACGQGPYEIQFPATNQEWLEAFDAVVVAPRALRGNFRAEDPVHGYGGVFGTGSPDNKRCVLTAAEKAAPSAPAAGGAVSVPVTGATASQVAPPPSKSSDPEWMPAKATPLIEVPPPQVLPASKRHRIGYGVWQNRQIGTVDITKKRPYSVIRFWFDEPNDLEGAVFLVEHVLATLAVPEAELQARARAKEEREHAESVRNVENYKRFDEERVARRTYCDSHHEDKGCWPKGYEQEMAERRAEERSTREWREEQKRHPSPPPKEPDRAPPEARAEAQPPGPSVNATWVAGYWTWNEGDWVWLGGRWRVPPEDVQKNLTVHAPTPPPPPPAEPAPPPAPSLVWTPGYWQWDGIRYVWVAGTLQKPPTPAAIWTPERWLPHGTGVVFLPGGWRIEIAPAPRPRRR